MLAADQSLIDIMNRMEDSVTLAQSLDMKNDHLGMHLMDAIRWLDINLHSVSFLEIVFARMQVVRKHTDSSWIDCELEIEIPTLEECVAKSIREASLNINVMFSSNLDWLPMIFLDECRSGESSMFAFKRNLIRMLNLIPVLMGSAIKARDAATVVNNKHQIVF